MADIPLTKSSLLRILAELDFAKEGFDLLEQKREILVLEVMHMVEAAKTLGRDLSSVAKDAYGALGRAMTESGAPAIWRAFEHVPESYDVSVSGRKVIGTFVPTVEVVQEESEMHPAYSLVDTSPAADETRRRFRELTRIILRMAEIQNAVIRLARELRKVQRRVNAIEKVYIPERETARKFIEDHLAETEREEFFVRKMMKTRTRRGAP